MFNLFRKKPDLVPPAEDSWSIGQADRDGAPMLLRLNSALKPFAGSPAFSHRIGVAVPLHAPEPNGLPGTDESIALGEIEDNLVSALCASRETISALVITTGGFREFVFYTSVPQDASKVLEQLRDATSSHKLQFYVESDPEWEVFRSFQF